MTDKKIIKLLKTNPEKGLSKAIDLYGGIVKWVCSKILGTSCTQDLEECISDVFFKLWKNIDKFDLTCNVALSSYICGIARHTAIDYRRKQHPNIELIPLEENDLGIDLDFADELALKINSSILQEAIDSLQEPDRSIFILRYYFCYKVKEIALTLDITAKSVENKLYRGKDTLKKSLIERGIIL
ncbi:MAG: RNA polymerase sigma factor [Aminipila sp.]